MIGTGRLLLANDDSELGAVEYDMRPDGGRIRPVDDMDLFALYEQNPRARLVLVTQSDERMEVRLAGVPALAAPRQWWRVLHASVG